MVGYSWLESGYPSTEWGEDNRDRLASGPPYMVVHGLDHPARRYEPLVDKPDLFQIFRDLAPDRESLLRFANQYGWIGQKGMVHFEGGGPLRAVGLSTWEKEIQDMVVAHRLLNLARLKDNQALREFFSWDPVRFDVRIGIEMDGRNMRGIARSEKPCPDTRKWLGWLAGGIVPPHIDIRRLGWKRHDYVLPALTVVEYIVNERTWELCRPVLLLQKDGGFNGYWTSVNLLGCIWLQFYLMLIGHLKLRRCVVCGGEMNVTNSRSSRRMHTRCSKNKRQVAWRAKLKSPEAD